MIYVNVEFQAGGPIFQYRAYQFVRRGHMVLVPVGDTFAVKQARVVSVGFRQHYWGTIKEIHGVIRKGWYRWLFPVKPPKFPKRRKVIPTWPEDFTYAEQDWGDR